MLFKMSLTQVNYLPNIDGKSIKIEFKTKVDIAISRLQIFEPPEGYFLAFGGGKDSVVIYNLAQKSDVKFDAHYNITGIDPPELVYFIREHYPDMIYEKPKRKLWDLIETKGLPRRNARFCCEYLKEHSGANRVVVTGIRWQESVRRRQRKMVETCRWVKGKSFVHPIIDWTTNEVWQYIKMNRLPYCCLYDEGFKRLGCILCPMKSKRKALEEIERYPKIAKAWYRAAERYFNKHKAGRIKSVDELWGFWLSRKNLDDYFGNDSEDRPSMFL